MESMRRRIRAARTGLMIALNVVLSVALATRDAESQDDTKETAQLRAMRSIAESVTVKATIHRSAESLVRVGDPIYRYADPARRFSDGTVWAWCRAGRPYSLLTIAPQRQAGGNAYWLCELTSLSSVPLSGDGPYASGWTPSSPGTGPQSFPASDAPAGDAPKRLRQMRELARGFKAYEYYAPAGQPSLERYELRLLPQPVLRYSDPSDGVVDGGLFIIAYGNNPEIALLIEAWKDPSAGPAWRFAMGRIAGAELHVEFRNREVWTAPKSMTSGLDAPYRVFIAPMSSVEP